MSIKPGTVHWCAIVTLASDLLAWMGMLALTSHDARRWEPKRLRLRLFTIPATIARTARQTILHLSKPCTLGQRRRPRDPQTRPATSTRLTLDTDSSRPDPHHPDPWKPDQPVTTTGDLSHPYDTINPTR